MSVTIETQRTGFYGELSEERRSEFLSLTRSKFLPTIDNIYYSVRIKNDTNDNPYIKPLLARINELKTESAMTRKPALFDTPTSEYGNGLQVCLKAYNQFVLCLSEPDLYDIFIANTLPKEKKDARIMVQIRAFGLWTRLIDFMILASYNKLAEILAEYHMEIDTVNESRIDYCYHTNAIQNPDKTFNDNYIFKHLETNMKKWKGEGDIETDENGNKIMCKDYVAYGSRKSGNVFARLYHKGKEVVQQGYKDFFFKIWHDNGLISAYDKYCLEYALVNSNGNGKGNYDYIHKARLMFYLEHGKDESRKEKYAAALSDKNTTLKHFKELADEYMPAITVVMNIEYETHRKFYYNYGSSVEDDNEVIPRENMPAQLERLFKIVDNRSKFLKTLTRDHLSFVETREPDKDGNVIYKDWWKRLQSAKVGGIKSDTELLRRYEQNMDERIIQSKMINAVASSAVYNDKLNSGFVEDFLDMLSYINDNDKARNSVYSETDGKERLSITLTKADGEKVEELHSPLLVYYATKKQSKEKILKNKKRKRNEKREAEQRELEATVAAMDARLADGLLTVADGCTTNPETCINTDLDLRQKAIELEETIKSEKHQLEVKRRQYELVYRRGFKDGVNHAKANINGTS